MILSVALPLELRRLTRAGAKATLPTWLNNETYEQKIQPRLAGITYSTTASVLGVSEPYAADIRAGRRRPHPRHWQALAQLGGVSPDTGPSSTSGLM
jgi:hypothetical protein